MTVGLILLAALSAALLLCLNGALFRYRKAQKRQKETELRLQEMEQRFQETEQKAAEEAKIIIAERDDAQKKLDMQRNMARDLYFARILGGYYSDQQSLLEEGRKVDVTFPDPLFLVLIARPETWGEDFKKDCGRRDIDFILRNVLEESFSGVTHAADVGGSIVAILNLETMPGMTEIVQQARHALEVLEAEFGLIVIVAISRVYHDVMAIHTAYDDALRVLEFRQILEEDYPITTYDELTYQKVGQPKTSYLELEQELLRCMRESNLPELRIALRKMISVGFGVSEMSIDTIRFRIYGIVNILLCMADDLREIIGHETIENMKLGPRLTSAQSLGDIIGVMDDILDALDERTFTASTSWVEEIPRYVEENFRDPDLNVSAVADHFGVTPTYCSKLYKERYAHRLHDQIQVYRIQAAKMLLQTDRSLDQVAEEVGFSNTLAMSRAFKKHEGATPGRFREENLRV